MAKIDIIIPVYNGGNMIKDTIKSVMASDFDDFWIILVDDGSTDNTSEVIRDLKETYSNISAYKKVNEGVSAARNYGITMATSPYICFLDADDLYDPQFLPKMYEEIIDNDKDLCFCGYNKLIDGEISPAKSAFSKKDFFINYMISKNKIHISNFLLKRSIIADNGLSFNENSSYGEDIEFMASAIKFAQNIGVVPLYLTNYRIDTNRQSLSSFDLAKIDEDIEFSKRLLSDSRFELSQRQKDAIYHKLAGNISMKLSHALSLGYDKEEVKYLYKKYQKFLNYKSLAFGLRSLRLMINIKNLKRKLGINR